LMQIDSKDLTTAVTLSSHSVETTAVQQRQSNDSEWHSKVAWQEISNKLFSTLYYILTRQLRKALTRSCNLAIPIRTCTHLQCKT
jgi:hypothetical protein